MHKIIAISHAYIEEFTRVGLLDNSYTEFKTIVVVPKSLAKKEPSGYRRLIAEKFDVIPITTCLNFHHSVRFYSLRLFKLLKRVKPDIVFINNEPWSSTAFQVVFFCKLFLPKTKIVIYTSENVIRKYPFPFNWLEKFVLNNTDTIAYVSKIDGEAVLKNKKFQGKIVYMPLSVDTNIFTKQERNNIKKYLIPDDTKTIIGYIGRLVREKGIDILFYAVKELNLDYHLLIIGNGPEKKYLLDLAAKLNISNRVSFIGYIEHINLPQYINCLDILVLPSRTTPNWKEQFGRILIEAMACEVSVIGSSSGEIPEVIGDCGLIFKEDDIDSLRENISILCSDKNLRQQLRQKARARVLSNYSRDLINKKTYDLYKTLINENLN